MEEADDDVDGNSSFGAPRKPLPDGFPISSASLPRDSRRRRRLALRLSPKSALISRQLVPSSVVDRMRMVVGLVNLEYSDTSKDPELVVVSVDTCR